MCVVRRSVKHSVAKFFGVADDDQLKRARTLRKWQASTRRLHNHSFVLSRRPSQRRTAPRHATATRAAAVSAAEYEMARRRRHEEDTAAATTSSEQMLASTDYDSADGAMVSMPTASVPPPHPLDPAAQPPMYVPRVPCLSTTTSST